MSLLQYIERSHPTHTAGGELYGIFLADQCASESFRVRSRKMPIFSFLLKRRLLQGIFGGASRSAQAGRVGGLLGGSFRKAAFAGITAMLVKRMLRRKSF
jgi:hypothetical protein